MPNASTPTRAADAARFSSFLATVLTLAGVAIGLGNVWRFPYMMGAYGGGAFLILFLVFLLLVAVPALVAELALARHHRGATITVLARAFGLPGRALGYALVAGTVIAMSYYSLVIGQVFYGAWFAAAHGFSGAGVERFRIGLDSAPLQYAVALAVVWAGVAVIDRGLKRGIERASNTIVPLFFAVALYLVYVALGLPEATARLLETLRPDFSRIGFKEVFAALGQCFFSVGLGATFVLVYGKFIAEDTDLRGAAACAAFGDLSASVLASLFVLPAVLAFGLSLDAGPRLLFDTLPQLFAVMPAGRTVATFMLGALGLVAFLSMVAGFQVVVVALEETPFGERLGRRRLVVGLGALETALLVLPATHPALIGPLDLAFGSGFPVAGGLLAVLAFGWTLRRPHAAFGVAEGRLARWLLVWLRFGIPPLLAVILFGTIYQGLRG